MSKLSTIPAGYELVEAMDIYKRTESGEDVTLACLAIGNREVRDMQHAGGPAALHKQMGHIPAGTLILVKKVPERIGVKTTVFVDANTRDEAIQQVGDLANGYADHDDKMPMDEYEEWQRACLSAMWERCSGAIFYNHKPRPLGELWLPLRLNPELPLRQIITWAWLSDDRETRITGRVRMRMTCCVCGKRETIRPRIPRWGPVPEPPNGVHPERLGAIERHQHPDKGHPMSWALPLRNMGVFGGGLDLDLLGARLEADLNEGAADG